MPFHECSSCCDRVIVSLDYKKSKQNYHSLHPIKDDENLLSKCSSVPVFHGYFPPFFLLDVSRNHLETPIAEPPAPALHDGEKASSERSKQCSSYEQTH